MQLYDELNLVFLDFLLKYLNIYLFFVDFDIMLIYLKASVPTLIAQIQRRGRDYEQNIDESYLSRLNEKYNHWIENIYEGRVLVIDKDSDDFVADPTVFERICAELEQVRASL